jgi:iron complex outermembrane receptor protein
LSFFHAFTRLPQAVGLMLLTLMLAACVSQPKPVQTSQAEEAPPPVAEPTKPSASTEPAPSEPTVAPPVPVPVPPVAELPRATADDTPVVEARPVIVTAQRGAYAVTRATTATKTDTPIMETPVSIQAVPRAVLDDQQVISVADAVRNVSGVQPAGYMLYDNFILRGFDALETTYRNGLRHQSTTGLETANLEAIEILKGPASILYGRVEPGGLINLATKRPLDVPYYSLQQQFGSYNFYRTTIDATGPLVADRTLLYRMNLAYKDNNTFQDLVSQQSIFFSPSLTWRPTDRFETTIEIEYQRNRFTDVSDIGIPAIGNRPAPIPLSRFLGDPAARWTQERVFVGFEWLYRLNDAWKLVNRFQFNDATYDERTLFATDFDPGTGVLTRGLFFGDQNRRTYATNLDLVGHVRTGPVDHNVLVGFDYYRFKNAFGVAIPDTPVPAININNPTYGGVSFEGNPNFFGTRPEQWYGVYFQDQVTLWDKLHILGGGRYDWAETGAGNSDTSLGSANAAVTKERTGYFSPRVGIVYRPWPWLSLYGNYVKSLGSNNGGTPLPGSGPLDPQTGRQWEGGIKTEFFDGRLTSTLAYFDLTKQNVATPIPGTFFVRTIGEANSRGMELDVSGRVTEQLSLIGSYAYTDARITRDDSGNEGHRLISVPRNSGSLWAVYEFTDGPFRGVRLGTGAFARSKRMADLENTAELPGYVRWDATAGYTFRYFGTKITAQLNVYNLLNKDYYDRASSRLLIQPGMPLTFLGSLRFEY